MFKQICTIATATLASIVLTQCGGGSDGGSSVAPSVSAVKNGYVSIAIEAALGTNGVYGSGGFILTGTTTGSSGVIPDLGRNMCYGQVADLNNVSPGFATFEYSRDSGNQATIIIYAVDSAEEDFWGGIWGENPNGLTKYQPMYILNFSTSTQGSYRLNYGSSQVTSYSGRFWCTTNNSAASNTNTATNNNNNNN